MERVVIVGAGLYPRQILNTPLTTSLGLYGLVAAKTYLQVAGVYDVAKSTDNTPEAGDAFPACFTETQQLHTHDVSDCRLLVIDSASDLGGTWAEERLYPNLLSQNSYGLYEFSDLPLSDVVPEEDNEDDSTCQFIAGWKINRYLHAWVDKWDLRKYIRLNWRVNGITRLESREWKLDLSDSKDSNQAIHIICDKLILATGLTSVPNLPNPKPVGEVSEPVGTVIHAKHVGDWARENLGYQPLPKLSPSFNSDAGREFGSRLRSVAIYGGAKSAFDLVHFFATLHRNDPNLHLRSTPKDPVQVHWIIRDKGAGPAWMAPPTSSLPNGETVASDKAASTRLLNHLSPCCYEIPKRLSPASSPLIWGWGFQMEGSWLARFFHGNPLGRWWIRRFWASVDQNLEEIARYSADPKLQKLRPDNSVVSCASSIGIANQRDLWETIRLPQVHVYRSTIAKITDTGTKLDASILRTARVDLEDGTRVNDVDLVVHATGYRPIVPVQFQPPSFRLTLGLSGLVNHEPRCDPEQSQINSLERINGSLDSVTEARIQHWHNLDEKSEVMVKKKLAATGCTPVDRTPPSWIESHKLLPYRLFRRMVAPELVAQGDRSFAVLGIVLSSTIAVVAEVQALWVAAFLAGGLDSSVDSKTHRNDCLRLQDISQDVMDNSISEDVVLGSLTGTGLEVDAIQVSPEENPAGFSVG
ncbi:hypothetical protein NUU61_009499 [Penicillium alfredii]|uniref:Uncharacterized protein n=1 Tax=Penicillium alfredii TaxID=1506179 RepID=A0A9W9ENC5_9EURO|nr:uncharacterized protein NUU61_009499 [Penicillium alfredii]KAJ5084920.1 hypothetical protein NUU61_009499 [Penicillium alfredii]